jgi:hypothetical protein
MRFNTPASMNNAYAATLIGAALNRARLAHDPVPAGAGLNR